MIKPADYKQTDKKWGSLKYAVRGEASTIKSAGCGPTAVADVLSAIVSPYIDPVTCAAWALQAGNWLIACMGKGLWTSSGHYIVAYGYEDGMVYINDPASSSAARACNSWDTFRGQVKYYWAVEVPELIKAGDIQTCGDYRLQDFVREVQMCTGAKIDGKAGTETLSKSVTVSRGKNSRHHVVLPLQKRLRYHGFYEGGLDGIAGPLFESAVNRYQTQVLGYKKADGEVTAGKAMWKSLLEL